MDLQLSKKNVMITGGSRGIGNAIAHCFAAEGANISICARNGNEIEMALSSLKKYGNTYKGHAADIQNKHEVEKWVKTSVIELGGIDIVILNASALSTSWDDCIRTDLLGAINTVEAVIPFLRKSTSAAITYISSKAASIGIPGAKAYSSIKAALVNYMKSLSLELTPEGIRVNTVSPGDTYFKGGYWDKIKNENPDEYKRNESARSFKRLARPEEIADCVAFISSPRASYVSGANLLVDGASMTHVVL